MAAESVTSTTAMSGGIVKSDGDSEIMSRGVCWSTTENPSIGDSKTSDGSGIGSFASILTGLLPNTRYYAKAYATNSLSTVYGNQVSFVTKQPGLAILTTITVVIKSAHEVESGGNITDDGGSAVIERGVCWSTSPNPSIPGNSKSDGSGTGSYITVVNNLSPGTAYHIRAYAINGVGTSYGDELTFTTPVILPILQTDSVTEIAAVSAKSGGIITSDGGGTITAKGVCWNITTKPTLDNFHTSDGSGSASFKSSMTGLVADTRYFVRAYATNESGTFYGDERSFITIPYSISDQIIADHTVVERFDNIPEEFLAEIKKMWVVVAGESHSRGYGIGLTLLEELYPDYNVSFQTYGTPEEYTDKYLRMSRATWGNYENPTGWIYEYGEGDWFTNSMAISRTKDGITYCNTNNYIIAAIGFGWCNDLIFGSPSNGYDQVYGCRWYGASINGPEGDLPLGIDADDFLLTGNSVCVNTYLDATQQYINYCKNQGYNTKVFFTTGPVDDESSWKGEAGYQGHLKHEHIRNYVKQDPSRILFDYADILCYDNNGNMTTTSWNDHTYPDISPANGIPVEGGHISNAGALRLAKAMWWMLARIAGWDGE
ncbi:MAG: hypothetical protein RBR81_13645 [Bacteroidales bacterium]|nr:hypothetical protein [Bacteroidales bacterium]